MDAYALVGVSLALSIIIVALALRRTKSGDGRPGVFRRALGFAGGPFPLSIAIHAAVLLFLIITVHESRGRDLIMVNLEAGGGGGSGSEMNDLDIPDAPMPEVSPHIESTPAISADALKFASLAEGYARAANGIGIGRGGGIGNGNG